MTDILKSPAENIFLVALDQDGEGFRQFIGSWVLRDGDCAAVIDPGPPATIPVLARALAELGISRLPYILLTHIHVDHAGGTGHLLRYYPRAAVVCHPGGMRHMVDPGKLWEATSRALGDVADIYGRPGAVPETNLICPDKIELGEFRIETVPTAGHAPHHMAFRTGQVIFSGDAAGEVYPLREGIYVRIAAGPGFNRTDYEMSLELLRSLQPSLLCFGHFGWTQSPEEYFSLHAPQARLWTDIARGHKGMGDLSGEAVFRDLLAADPGIRSFPLLPADIRAREKRLMLNSLRFLAGR
jgi:glyoxylase-like metal-dependent hydrolase (beta-lactamase superfamily II)